MSDKPTPIRLTEPSHVVRVLLERKDDQLTLAVDLGSEQIRFIGVSELRFRGRTTLKKLVVLLAEDITDRGWEDARFAVRDQEQEFIAFNCREIERLPT